MTAEEFAQVVALITEEHPEAAFTDGRHALWWESLKSYPADAVRAATIRMLQESPYPPKLAHLVERIRGGAALVRDVEEVRALEAWQQALRCIEDPYHTYAFQDRAIPLAMELLGSAQTLREKPIEEVEWARREFCKVYTALRSTGRTHHTGRIVGIIESGNREAGRDLPPALVLEQVITIASPSPDPAALIPVARLGDWIQHQTRPAAALKP